MSRWIRWSGAAAVWLGVMALSTGDGMAADAASTGAASPKFSALPEIALGAAPGEKDRPKTVLASSRFPGLWSAMKKPDKKQHFYGVPGQRQIGLFVSKDDATAFSDRSLRTWERRPKDSQHPAAATTCFAVLNHWELSQEYRQWPLRLQQWPQVRSAAPGSVAAKQSADYQKVRAFQIERLVISTTKKTPGATLHVQQGWFDPVSFGGKETKSIAAKFTLVATGPGGVQVFAARDTAEKAVEFVVYNPILDKKERRMFGHHMQTRRAGQTGSSDCGHARLSLKTSPGTGDYGSAQFDVVLPDDARTNRQAKKQREKSVAKGDPTRAGAREPHEVRVRKLVVHVGVSQGLKEKEPTTTVAFGWQGRERRQQIF